MKIQHLITVFYIFLTSFFAQAMNEELIKAHAPLYHKAVWFWGCIDQDNYFGIYEPEFAKNYYKNFIIKIGSINNFKESKLTKPVGYYWDGGTIIIETEKGEFCFPSSLIKSAPFKRSGKTYTTLQPTYNGKPILQVYGLPR